MFSVLTFGLALGACQTAKLSTTTLQKPPQIPVHSTPKTDPEGPAFTAKSKAEAVVATTKVEAALGQTVVTPKRKQVATLPPASEQNVALTRHRKIALLLPLSGPRARIGRELLDAAQIALCLLYTSPSPRDRG